MHTSSPNLLSPTTVTGSRNIIEMSVPNGSIEFFSLGPFPVGTFIRRVTINVDLFDSTTQCAIVVSNDRINSSVGMGSARSLLIGEGSPPIVFLPRDRPASFPVSFLVEDAYRFITVRIAPSVIGSGTFNGFISVE